MGSKSLLVKFLKSHFLLMILAPVFSQNCVAKEAQIDLVSKVNESLGTFKIESCSNRLKSLQEMQVSGKISNERGDPSPVVIVNMKVTTKVTVSDTQGDYQVTVPPNDNETLVFKVR